MTHIVLSNFCLHFALSDARLINSLEELCIKRVAAITSVARVLNPQEGSIYIVIYKQFHL